MRRTLVAPLGFSKVWCRKDTKSDWLANVMTRLLQGIRHWGLRFGMKAKGLGLWFRADK